MVPEGHLISVSSLCKKATLLVLTGGASLGLLAAGTPAASAATARPHATVGQHALYQAYAQVGKPYRWGAQGPGGFDCSGLMAYAYGRVGVALPHNALAQYRSIHRLPVSQVRVGDLIFMADSGSSTDKNRIDHVGIYAGNHYWYVASSSGTVVRKQWIWTNNIWVGRPY